MKHLRARVAAFAAVLVLTLSIGFMNTSYAQEEEFVFDTAPDMDNWSSGPEVGETIPEISGTDQHGNQRNFADIKGPNGVYVVFHRSADW